MRRFLVGIGIAIGIFIVVWFFLLPFEQSILENNYQVSPIPGIKQTVWLQNFFLVGVYCLGLSIGITIVWQLFGQFSIHISSSWLEISRGVWIALFVLLLLTVLIGGFFLNFLTQDSGRYYASAFYALNGFLIYYISSLFSSPTNVKFAPWGSKFLP